MILERILNGINIIETIGDTTLEISGIHIDSRKVETGHLFVAVKGTQTDGHAYIGKAIEKGGWYNVPATEVVCTDGEVKL